MKITCWGARGSIPVSGKEFTRFFASQFPKLEDFLKHLDEALEKKDLD